MRRAIIETMQKREKLRIRREQQKAKREKEVKKEVKEGFLRKFSNI